ncbi:MAG TPA: sugar phosphate nucleotidyltransferase [Gemmatimonadaceae bacterium]|nr:sugar phosphate nucleotidyltransferase [Gemmatimonadaceae bacterium]
MKAGRVLIPCGGRGTRMASLTRGAPKELLEIAGVPVVIRVLEECAKSGITDALVVIAPDKPGLVERLAHLAGTRGMPATIGFAIQHEPRGLADAIRLGRAFSSGLPLAVALPDNLFGGDEPAMKQVIDTHIATGKSVVAMVEISADEAAMRGPTSVYPGHLEGDEYVLDRIPGKGERGTTFDTGGQRSAFTGVGRYVFNFDVFDAIDAVDRSLPTGAELDDVPVMQHLHSAGGLTGRRIKGKFFDVGLISGYQEANREYGN